jgi:hypothetical protein
MADAAHDAARASVAPDAAAAPPAGRMAAAATLIIAAALAPAAATSAAAVATVAAAAERGPSPAPAAFTAFLSHAQASGGNQVLVLREALRTWAPAASVWHDLNEQPTAEGMLAGAAGAAVFLLFLSRSVLARPAVRLEVGTALALGKPLVLVLERDAVRGGAPDAAELLREGRAQQELALTSAGANSAAVERVRALTNAQWAKLEALVAATPPIVFERGLDERKINVERGRGPGGFPPGVPAQCLRGRGRSTAGVGHCRRCGRGGGRRRRRRP